MGSPFYIMLAKRIASLFVLVLWLDHTWSQKMDRSEIEKLYYKSNMLFDLNEINSDSIALLGFKNVIKDISVNDQKDSYILFDSNIKAGRLEQTYGSLPSAIRHYKSCIAIQEEFKLPDTLLFHPFLFIGMIYSTLEEKDSAILYMEEAERISNKNPGISERYRLFNSLGVIYYTLGNYVQSINYFRKAIKITPHIPGYSEYLVSAYQSNIGSALRKLGEYDSAANLYRNMIETGVNEPIALMNLGRCFIRLNYPDSALRYLKLSNIGSAYVYNSVAEAYLLKQDSKSAFTYLKRAIKLADAGQSTTVVAGYTYKLKGDAHFMLGAWDLALKNYQKSLTTWVNDFNDSSIYANPQKPRITFIYYLFETLIAKAGVFDKLYRNNEDTRDLAQAIDTYDLAMKTSDFIAKNFDNDDARLFHSSISFSAYQEAVDLLILAYVNSGDKSFIKKAFEWSEQSKANSLAINLKENQLKRKKNLPDSIIRREGNLKFSLSQLLSRLDRAKNREESDRLENEILNIELALSRVRARFHDYDRYYRQKFAYDSVSIDFIQKEVLSNTTALLSYFYSDSTLYQFVLTQDHISAHKIAIDREYEEAIFSFENELQTIKPGRRYQGHPASRVAYRRLFSPLEPELKGIKSLIILPHGPLYGIPFEALEDENGHYLLEKYDITYQYAASFLQTSEKEEVDLEKMIAVAPFGGNVQGDLPGTFLPLLFSEQEIEQLEGIKLTREQGTKSNFLKYKDEVSVIHLATHAIVNNEDPSRSFIAFFPDKAEENNYKLFAHELYNTTMSQTQLAFLSACETAQGKLVSGEGIMSLSRAFAYAGCPNMITSLWKAEDHTTAFISQRFYHHLKNGLDFSKALRQAKIDLLQSPQYAQFHSPSYWSHLVFVGSPSAHSNTQPAWVYVLVLLALVGFLAYKGRRILKRSVLKNKVSK